MIKYKKYWHEVMGFNYRMNLQAAIGVAQLKKLARKKLNFDFDDAYQYAVAKHYGLKIVTMDRDFARVTDMGVIFIQYVYLGNLTDMKIAYVYDAIYPWVKGEQRI